MANELALKSFTEDQVQLIKNTVCRNASDNELQLFLYTCNHTGLDPFLKQIYAIKRGGTMTFQTSIDGLRVIAERTKCYAPGPAPTFHYGSNNALVSATAYVKKMTRDGVWHEVSATAYMSEYAQEFNGKLTQFWNKMPHVMIAKCAEALALRKAFPFEIGSLYVSEEMANGLNKNATPDDFLTEESIGMLPQDSVEVEIPEGIEEDLFKEYLEYLCKMYKRSEPELKRMINENPQKFWAAYHKWAAKKEASDEVAPQTEPTHDETADTP